jgi:rhodanese-related sulfurtransferase
MSQYLRQRSLRTVPAAEAAKLAADGGGWVLIDVRPPASHEKAHPRGAVSCPLYVPLQVDSVSKGLKALAYAFNGVSGVQPNLQFEEQLLAALEGGKKGALFIDEAGGTLRATPNFPAGKSSRSLQAAFRALRDDLIPEQAVLHVSGGCAAWFREGLEFVGQYDASEAGKTPNAAADASGEFVEAAKERMGMK